MPGKRPALRFKSSHLSVLGPQQYSHSLCVCTAVLTCPVMSHDGYVRQLLPVHLCRFAAMHQGNPIHTFMFDKEGVLLSANPAALQRRPSGKLVPPQSLLSTSSPAHIHPSRTRLQRRESSPKPPFPAPAVGSAASAPPYGLATSLHGRLL